MANELDKVSLLVSSCDLYEDAWNPFFQLIHKNWPQHPNHVFLLSEEKTFDCDYMHIETIHTKKGTPWTERLRFALDKIDTEYVLFSLEDYFVHAQVNNDAFIDAVKQLDAHTRWGGIWFHPIKKGTTYPKEYKRDSAYLKTKRLKRGRTNMMIILYRKAFLSKLLVEIEDAWKFEVESNVRSVFAGYDVISYDIHASEPIFKYYNKHRDGVGITSRKWLNKTHEIFEQNGIYDVDYSKLGVLDSTNASHDPTNKKMSLQEICKLPTSELIYYYIKRPIRNSKCVVFLKASRYWLKYYRNCVE